jgi:hypothetical protein
MRAPLISSLMLFVALFGACGGRLVKGEGDDGVSGSTSNGASDGEGASSNGATSSSGGASSSGARPSTGGVPSRAGGPAMGGSFGTSGTSPTGGACACPAIECGPNARPVPNPDGCCYHCESGCSQVMCPAIACGSGSHPEMVPGQCCLICIQDSCEQQRAIYQDFRRQLVEKYSFNGCMIDSDCSVYYEKNQCGVGCGIPIPTSTISNLDSNLQSFAQQTCSAMCPIYVPPCEPTASPICINGMCR